MQNINLAIFIWLTFCIFFKEIFGIFGEFDALKCTNLKDHEKFDCFSENGVTADLCQARGCCWVPTEQYLGKRRGVPACFYPINHPNYKVDAINSATNGYTGQLSRTDITPEGSPYKDLSNLELNVVFETETRLRIRLLDPRAKRWEVPIPLSPPDKSVVNPGFEVKFSKEPFGIQVLRKSDKMTLFDTNLPQAPLRYADQFLELSAKVGVWKGYGLGETRGRLMHNLNNWTIQALWSRDVPPQTETNLYGLHNLFVGLSDNGTAYGIFFLNSNAQEVAYQPLPAITYRTIGGVLDFFIFLGPEIQTVMQQYQELIGQPMLPPFWSLGFHLSRYGVKNTTELRSINKRNREAKIPFDVQWSDIDYMESYLDWTYDKVNYAGLPDLINEIHGYNMKYVIIIDPGISNERVGNYVPYDEGIRRRIFVNKHDNSAPIIGKVWPGTTAFPDFTNPKADEYWYDMAAQFHREINFDGIWIDMNEPSNFYDGSLDGCIGNKLDHPPYVPHVLNDNLMAKTLCPSAQHYNTTHYNVHSMYGYFEAKSTNYALKKIHVGKRPFILTRSSFAGSGVYTFHWTGDNQANWENLRYSIAQIINFNMFGIPMVGADICGFLFNSNEELCIRWMQLGSFYPFMRNHADKASKEQDPAIWSPLAVDMMRESLRLRYAILPYFYSLFYRANVNGTTVARSLSFEFPRDNATHAIDSQFMVGPSLLISPVITQGSRNVNAYIPDAIWCDVQDGQRLNVRKKMTVLDAPLYKINVHIRGGSIIPTLPPALNTVELRKGSFGLSVCFDDHGIALGELYWDDGESLDSVSRGAYNLVNFQADISQGSLLSRPVMKGYTAEPMVLDSVGLAGIQKKPSKVVINGQSASFSYDPKLQLMSIGNFKANLTSIINIQWS